MPSRSLAVWLAALACGLTTPLLAQASGTTPAKRPLSHDDYDGWKSLRGTTPSPDGKWVAYAIEPQWGDGVLEVRATESDTVHRHPLGSGPRFSADSRFVVFTIGKSKVEERNKRIEELAKKGKIGAAGEESSSGETPSFEPGVEPTPPARGGGGARGGRGGGAGAGGGAGGTGGRGDLGILDLTTGKVEVIARIKGFRLLEEQPVLVYHLDKPEEKKDEAKKDDGAKGESKPEEGKPNEGEAKVEKPAEKPAEPTAAAESPRRGEGRGRRGRGGAGAGASGAAGNASDDDDPAKRRKEGTTLVVRDLTTKQETRIDHVATYGLTRKDKWLYVHVCTKTDDPKLTPKPELGLFALAPRVPAQPGAAQSRITLLAGLADFASFASTEDGTSFAFTSNKEDWNSKKPISDLYLWDGTPAPAARIVHRQTDGLPAGKVVSTGGASFSKDGRVLAFSVQDPPEPDAPLLLPEEKIALDLWHWQDGLLQTQQAKQASALKNPAWSCVFHRDGNRVVVLGDAKMPRARLLGPDGSRALVLDDTPYEKLITWDARYRDVYLVNTIDGSKKKVAEKLRDTPTNSPKGKWLTWFGTDYAWHALDVQTGAVKNLTQDLGVAFHRSDDDHPHPDPAHGLAGWTADDNEVVLYDEFDLWKVAPATGQAVCITDGLGRAHKTRLRYQRMADDRDDDDREYLPESLWLLATDTETMAESVYRDSLTELSKPQRLLQVDKNLGDLTKAKHADRLFFTLQTFAEFPDVWTSALDFQGQRKLTDANPQQKNIAWGAAELVRWTSTDGRPLKGILVKPDGFDASRKYPMLVHFYERSSQGLHNFVAPSPGTSPNAAYYVSNGYLWFMPDIYYDEGYPGESCVKCVVSGIQSLIAKGFVDEQSIGAAGHSWGGYQTAFLVTRTRIFAAVESGAPVCNMVSAYGGIRYGSGQSRQFQYEQTQSRIGGTPWQYPLRYLENSPIHFADKVKTPVLILHNDQDGAVPWTQGIEYFTALRRLGKETYLFNYTGEDHGLRKRPNQKDWTRRMAEYFDHHLRGKAKPKWMQEGVPFIERDQEKLPFIPSYADALAAKEKAKALEATAPASTQAPASTGAPVPAGASGTEGNGSK
jgi:dipeptidyl aminopeptidase/acylaminoacyl peptidase